MRIGAVASYVEGGDGVRGRHAVDEIGQRLQPMQVVAIVLDHRAASDLEDVKASRGLGEAVGKSAQCRPDRLQRHPLSHGSGNGR